MIEKLKKYIKHRSDIKFSDLNSPMGDPGEIDVFTDKKELSEHQKRRSWYIEYSGDGIITDLNENGFVLEYYKENRKLTFMFKDFEDFEKEVENITEYTRHDISCWVCGKSPIRTGSSSLRAIESKLLFTLFGRFHVMVNTENTGQICQSCQEELLRRLITETDLIDKGEVISRKL